MATSTSNAAAFEKSLTKRLRGLSADEIKRAVKAAGQLQQSGVVIDDAFPLGKPLPDGVSLRGHLPIDKAGQLGAIVSQLIDVREMRAFPRGIIRPDLLRLHFNVGP